MYNGTRIETVIQSKHRITLLKLEKHQVLHYKLQGINKSLWVITRNNTWCKACTSYRNFVCPSVCPAGVTSRYQTKPRWDRNSRLSPYDSVEFLVFFVTKFRAAGWGDSPSNDGVKQVYPLRNRYCTTINSSSLRAVTDRHRLVAHHNKHYWRAFQWYQHWWPWTTSNHQH